MIGHRFVPDTHMPDYELRGWVLCNVCGLVERTKPFTQEEIDDFDRRHPEIADYHKWVVAKA